MILAAGRGSRMGQLTDKTPKPLTKLGDSTLIEHNILRLINSGITDICINISYLGYQIKDYLNSKNNLGVNITFLDETKEMLGTGGGILNALDFLGEQPFWLVNADLYSNYKIPIEKSLEPGMLGHLILVANPPHNSEGDFHLNDNKIYTGNNCRPFTYSGISLLSPKLLADIKERIFPLEPILESNADAELLTGEFFSGIWRDIGTQDRLASIKNLI